MQTTVQLSNGGRLVIPSKMRQALRLEAGSRMVAILDEVARSIRLVPVEEALDTLQIEAAELLRGAPSLAAELIAERRAEAARG